MNQKVLDEISSVILEGLGNKKKYDWVRKILALTTILNGDAKNPESAAQHSDEELYRKHLEHEVGQGNMTEEEAAEEMTDRNAASFVTLARNLVAHGVEVGCIAVGTAIGTYFGNPVLGKTIGGVVGRFLNKPVGDVVAVGATRILEFTTTLVTAVRERCENEWERFKEWLKECGKEKEGRLADILRGQQRETATA